MPTPIQKKLSPAEARMGQGNEVCDECRARVAARFCLCITPVRKYCEECDLNHYQKARHLTHSIHPMSAYREVISGRVPLESFRKKQLYINDLKHHIDEELVQFDAFKMQVENEFDVLISQITAKKEETLRDLQTLRIKLAGQLNEVQQIIEAKRYAESFEVISLLDDYILSGYSRSQGYSEKMFFGKLELEQVKGLLGNAVSYKLFDPNLLATIDIPVIEGNTLRLYNARTLQCSSLTLTLSTKINNGTSICSIGYEMVLCCGGNGHNDVYEVNIRTGNTLKVANTNLMRRWVGIWNYKGVCVYAFGGYNGSKEVSTSEKYIIERKAWVTLSNSMHKAKDRCSVCEHSTGLYISGTDDSSNSLECFNPIDETFRLIRTDSIGCQSILLCVDDQLYFIRKDKIETANLANGPEGALLTVIKTIPQIGNGAYWLSQPAVLCGGKFVGLLNINKDPCGIFSFDYTQVQFTQVTAFTY